MRSEAGLSLIELLVALTLLSVGALAMAGSSAAAVRAAREGRRAREDATRAREAIERSVAAGCAGALPGSVRLLAAPITRGRFHGGALFALRTC